MENNELKIVYVPVSSIKFAEYNPRKWSSESKETLRKSLEENGFVDPVILNSAPERMDVLIGGHFRVRQARELGYKEVPAIYLSIPDIEKEKKLNLQLNRAIGEWDFKLLAEFDPAILDHIGFTSEELDDIFGLDDTPEEFDLNKELKKLNIEKIEIQKGDVIQLGENRLMCGDSTVEEEMTKLMNGEKAAMCFTDPPYILDYLKGKKKAGEAVTGFGAKRNRRYLETDVLPPDFTEKWMANIHRIQQENFSIIVYENWKNIRTIWDEMEKYWRVKNMLVWHLPNRTQGFSGKYRFFSKHDIAVVGASPDSDIPFNLSEELDGLQNEYETALYAIAGKPQWESYKKGKKYQPTDFIECVASDEKSSGQGIIFGTKPLEILIPYIKVLTKRGDLIVEPFGGSGSTLIAATKMKRRCYLMEKSPVYAEVIKNRWEKLTGEKGVKVS
ncbi:MAG: ParB domain protein nuclease [Candidatus Shapirobacteria bacterium GW2011_GWE1_38_10]|uniref:ParB domain protein nuclease n=1 Tax=Candidatus Shapirobacteria bacterium GW2011_GWE1_38_10 TaxID=1618488 RepID=A0A0G0L9Z7_9BACT|nr:MAG: ParB domain protein nuclease [Candidatus Shapirobacteria bacterium GW2011_GWE1_38_10]